MLKRRCLVIAAFVATLFMAVPTSASWGAGWHSGSVVGQSTGTVPVSDGTHLKATVAPFGCPSIDESGKCVTDDGGGEGGDSSARPSISMATTTTSDLKSILGAVFCKRTDNESLSGANHENSDGRGGVFRAKNLVKVSVDFSGNTTVNNHKFEVRASVPQSVLDSLDAKKICRRGNEDPKDWERSRFKIVDFVPREFTVFVAAGSESKNFDCKMKQEDFDDLSWNPKAGRPANKPYQC
jgi:hypothetical protein